MNILDLPTPEIAVPLEAQRTSANQKSMDILAAIVMYAEDAIISKDLDGMVISWNKGAEEIFGYTEEEMVGKSILNLSSPDLFEEELAIMQRIANREKISHFETHRFAKGGQRIEVSLTISPIIDSTDQVIGVSKIARDITQLVKERAHLNMLAACMTHSNDAVIVTEAEPTDLPGPRIVYVNPAFERITGYTSKEVIGKTPRMLQGPKSDPAALRRIRDALSQWKPVSVELINYTKDGTEFLVELDINPVANASGWYVHWVSVQRDITERKANSEQLRKLSLAVEQSMDSVILTNLQGTIDYVNQDFLRNTGYSREEVIGKNPRMLQSGKTPPETFLSMWSKLSQGQPWRGDFYNRRKNGSEYIENSSITPILNEAGKTTHYAASNVDVTQKKMDDERILSLAFYDQLTQVPNRLLLINRLQQALMLSRRNKQFGALLFIDLDHFKSFNDKLGHDGGDALLMEVAGRLVSCVRESDTVSRFGGDEFVIMLPEIGLNAFEAGAIAESIARKIIHSFTVDFKIKNHMIRSSSSIGISLFSGRIEKDALNILKQADLAMYTAKAAGRNTHKFFDDAMQNAVNARAVIENDLRLTLDRNQFCLFYQPQLNDLGQITGAEALLRMNNPERGIVGPIEFIAVAEESGLIISIGYWVIQTACEQLVIWASDAKLAKLTLSVNISAAQFSDSIFVEKVLSILQNTGVNASLLKFEPTESILMKNFEDVINKMGVLRSKGVRFALDDFGTGYSSLSYLNKLPLDQLKIDQSFVQQIPHDANACSIVKAIITMAKSMELEIIAEGVETEVQRDYLLNNGCHSYQGYLFSRPVPQEQFSKLVRSN